MARLVLVTGQHRSGTSATAGCLGLFGLAFGDRLLAANAANPRGFFEDLRIVGMHDSLLQALGAAWDRPEDVPPRWWRSDPRAAAMAMERLIPTLREFASMSDQFVLKDPRAALFMPLWRAACEEADVFLAVLQPRRRLEAVARSLAVREGWSPAHAWRVVCGYQTAINDWGCLPGPVQIEFPSGLWSVPAWDSAAAGLGINIDFAAMPNVLSFLDWRLVHHA